MNKKDYISPKLIILEISSINFITNSASLVVNNIAHDYTEYVDEEFF